MTTHALNTGSALHAAEAVRPAQRPAGVRPKKDAHKGTIEFRLIFAAAFFVFLFASAIERMLPTRWSAHAASDTTHRKSIVQQAKESASIAAGYAFMG